LFRSWLVLQCCWLASTSLVDLR